MVRILSKLIAAITTLSLITGLPSTADSSRNNSKTKDADDRKSTAVFNLHASIKLRDSAPKLSLPNNLFEPWWVS
jgi:hypothetical protein